MQNEKKKAYRGIHDKPLVLPSFHGAVHGFFGRPGFRKASAVPADSAYEIGAGLTDLQPQAILVRCGAGVFIQCGDVFGYGGRQCRFARFL